MGRLNKDIYIVYEAEDRYEGYNKNNIINITTDIEIARAILKIESLKRGNRVFIETARNYCTDYTLVNKAKDYKYLVWEAYIPFSNDDKIDFIAFKGYTDKDKLPYEVHPVFDFRRHNGTIVIFRTKQNPDNKDGIFGEKDSALEKALEIKHKYYVNRLDDGTEDDKGE